MMSAERSPRWWRRIAPALLAPLQMLALLALAPAPARAIDLADADLRKQVVHVAVRLAGARDDGDLAGERAAAADAVHLQQIRRADRADQGRVALGLVGRQPVAQEERAARSAGTHQDTGKGDRLHGTDHPVLIDACELHCWDQLIDWMHQ